MKFGERKTIPSEDGNIRKAKDQRRRGEFMKEVKAHVRQGKVLGNFKARENRWLNSLHLTKQSPDRQFRKSGKPEKFPGYVDNFTPEQVARILGLEDIREIPKEGEFPLRGGAKLIITGDGRTVLYGYSPDGKDVQDIMKAMESGEIDLKG